MEKIERFATRGVEITFYAIFFLIPLVLTSSTSELFELNKMWLTFALTIIIGFFWLTRMIVTGKFQIQRTPLDIPIFLFLISQVVSTIFSWDQHVSLWGYYSRFNGGLLSIITYIFLYYAFVSNFINNKAVVRRSIFVTLGSGLAVALWGLPSHFGYDPTCLIFRGTLDVSCWTMDFQPKVRIFSTLGQPDWLAGYLLILIPLSIGLFLSTKNKILSLGFFALSLLFVIDLLYTKSRGGFLALIVSLLIYFIFTLNITRGVKNFVAQNRKIGVLFLVVLSAFFLIGLPFSQTERFSYQGIKTKYFDKRAVDVAPQLEAPHASALGGTDSGKIRLIVWRGALDTFLDNPIIGTGVETFAYSYYKYRPIAHNQTSEWNFLYNKAHNEYLNYLATTGIFGFLTYYSFIYLFLFIGLVLFFKMPLFLSRILPQSIDYEEARSPLALALLAGFLGIIGINFFGFSVVVLNIYLFTLPALYLVLTNSLDEEKKFGINAPTKRFGPLQWAEVSVLAGLGLYLLFVLFNFWNADKVYAAGYNLNRAGQYQEAYPLLAEAVKKRPGEPVYRDEMATNNAVIGAAVLSQGQSATGSAKIGKSLVDNAIKTNDELIKRYPKNILFLKSRVRIFYNLAQVDPEKYRPLALDAIKKAAALAPTDASVLYNLGVLYGQSNDTKKAIETLEKVVEYKPDYRDGRFALGLFYNDLAVNSSGQVIDPEYRKKASVQLRYILERITPDDQQTKDTLAAWEGS